MILPRLALSVRQPWAWAIIHGKDIENRDWIARGAHCRSTPVGQRVCLHASQGMTIDEYWTNAEFISRLIGIACPPPHELVRGAIIGTMQIDGITNKSDSPWFSGPLGLRLSNPLAIETPIRVEGALGWFAWAKSDAAWPQPAKWMIPKPEGML